MELNIQVVLVINTEASHKTNKCFSRAIIKHVNNSHSFDKLTDERGILGNTGRLRKVNSCCYVKRQFAETFKMPS